MSGSKYGSYREFKASDGGWLGNIPKHWSANKLKFIASSFASNVDKKTKKGERAVKLCNYTDVYYNDVMTPEMPFMTATATDEQVVRFTLRAGDIIITKDSEDPEDIAVPAFVAQDMPGVICGYHLAVVRPGPTVFPKFLNRAFQCAFARAYFATRANGLTRYGLGGQALDSVVLPVPPLKEQTQIAKFLDYETAKIDALIVKQQQLIALLQEKRQAVISHAVTKGLNPDVLMRDSGVEWLGDVPAHWDLSQLKYLIKPGTLITYGIVQAGPHIEDGVPYIKTSNMSGAELPRSGYSKTSKDIDESYRRSRVFPGDIVVSIRATVGKCLPVPEELTVANLTQGTAKISPGVTVQRDFLLAYMRASPVQDYLMSKAKGATFKEITLDMLRRVPTVVPPMEEQAAICAKVQMMVEKYDRLASTAAAQAELLKERRTALISAAVTGRIDVRGWKPPESETEEDVP